MSDRVYRWQKGSRYPAKLAQVLGETLEELASETGDVRPERLVEQATNPESELHPLFTWDDAEAARKHRIHEARQFIRCVVKVQLTPQGAEKETRAFVNLRDGLNDERSLSYVPIGKVLADDEWRE